MTFIFIVSAMAIGGMLVVFDANKEAKTSEALIPLQDESTGRKHS